MNTRYQHGTIRITESEIRNIIRECVEMILEDENASFKKNDPNMEILSSHEEIGFANKFYTLWMVYERKYSKTYVYVKNISFSEQKAAQLYPNATFNPDLRGKTRTFTVSVSSGESGRDRPFALPHTEAEIGQPIDLQQFLVQDAGIKYTKYGKPYFSIEGVDYASPFGSDFVMNLWNPDQSNLPSKGDILSVKGIVGIYNEKADTIYLNNTEYKFVKRNTTLDSFSENGQKIKERMIVVKNVRGETQTIGGYKSVKKPGFIVFANENGEEFFIDTLVDDYRTGNAVQKFDTSGIFSGDEYLVSGIVKKVNGLSKLLRAKMELISQNNHNNEEQSPKKIKKIFVQEILYSGRKVKSSDAYGLNPEQIDEFLQYVWKLKEDYEGRIVGTGLDLDNSSYDKFSMHFHNHIQSLLNDNSTYRTFDLANLYISFKKTTNETMVFNVKIFYDLS